MAKGYNGETCAEAVQKSVRPQEVVPFAELVTRIRALGSWNEETIWQHLMPLVVNLPPARHHWEGVEPILFLRPDGQYELYDQSRHPRPIAE